jgi:hypothetical protein
MKIEPKLKSINEVVHRDPNDSPVSDVEKIGIWGIALILVVLAFAALCFVWLAGDWIHISRLEEKQAASVWIFATFAVLVLLSVFVSRTGAFHAAGAVFKKQTGVD